MSFVLPKQLHPSVIVIAITFVSLILRLSVISQGPYHVDCLLLAIKAQETFETGRLSYALGFGYPVVVFFGALLIALFGWIDIHDPVLAMNVLSVVFGSLAVGMFYLFVRRLLDEITAFFGAILFSVSPVFLATSVYGMNHAPSVFFLLTSLYFIVGYLKSGRFVELVLAGFFLGCMGSSRTQDMILAIPAIGVLFMMQDCPHWTLRWRRFFGFLCVAFSVMIVFHLPYLINRDMSYNIQIKDYWLHGLIKNFGGVVSRYLGWNLNNLITNFSWPGLILGVIGLACLSRDKPNIALFLSVWFLVPFFFLANLLMGVPRFFIMFIPAIVIGQAYGLAIFFQKGKIKQWCAGLLFLVLITSQLLVVWPSLVLRHRTSFITAFSYWIASMTEDSSKIIGGDEGPFIGYYGKRTVMTTPNCLLGCSPELLQNFKDTVDSAILEGPVYITGIGLFSTSVGNQFSDFIKSNYRIQHVGQHLFEDWHYDCFVLRIFEVDLFRLTFNKS